MGVWRNNHENESISPFYFLPHQLLLSLSLSLSLTQLEPSESASSSNLSLAKPRPNSELNGQSPSHLKVQRSVSSNHKQRRYSEQGEGGATGVFFFSLTGSEGTLKKKKNSHSFNSHVPSTLHE